MKQVNAFVPSDPEWDRYLGLVEHDIYHLPGYLAAEDGFRGHASRLFVVSEAEHVLLIPLTMRTMFEGNPGIDCTSPYGYPAPLITSGAEAEWVNEAISALLEHLRELGVVSLFVRFHPLMGVPAQAFRPFGTVVEQGRTVAVSLQRPFEDIRAGMRKGTRYDIKRALRDGQVAGLDEDWKHFEEFLTIYRETMDRVGAGEHYYFTRKYFERLRDDVSNHLSLWTTLIEGQVAAASLISECDGVVQYHLSGTNEAFLPQYPTKVLLDRAIEWANERGNRVFHLGGGLGGVEDSLFMFKSGFAKDLRSFFTARIVIDAESFGERCAQWERMSGRTIDPAGFFPPYCQQISA